MHGFWSKKRANDNAPSLSSDDSRDESLSSPTSSIAKFAEKNSVPTSVVITSSSNAYVFFCLITLNVNQFTDRQTE